MDPHCVGETVAAVIDAGGVGINIEDGHVPPKLLAAKIAAAKRVADRAGVTLFVNARTDVYLHNLVPPIQALGVTLERGRQYREAGCDGFFVPGLVDAGEIRTIAQAIDLPLNVMVLEKLPSVATLADLGVRRVSAGTWIAKAALSTTRRAALEFLSEGRYEAMLGAGIITYDELNALFPVDDQTAHDG
jgi:2-methylisocitrate lyase-like PEP mutase family enzyme